MTDATPPALSEAQIEAAQTSFLAHLPKMQAVLVHYLHHRCGQTQDDLIQNAESLCWKAWVSETAKGKDPAGYVSMIALRAVHATFAGRHIERQQSPKDVLSPRAKRMRGFQVERLGTTARSREELNRVGGQHEADAAEERLSDTRTPVPDQAAFNIDFAEWLGTLSPRDREMALGLMAGDSTTEAAERFGLTQGRISQKRRQLAESWEEYVGERGTEIATFCQ
jgi:hypothetical protein